MAPSPDVDDSEADDSSSSRDPRTQNTLTSEDIQDASSSSVNEKDLLDEDESQTFENDHQTDADGSSSSSSSGPSSSSAQNQDDADVDDEDASGQNAASNGAAGSESDSEASRRDSKAGTPSSHGRKSSVQTSWGHVPTIRNRSRTTRQDTIDQYTSSFSKEQIDLLNNEYKAPVELFDKAMSLFETGSFLSSLSLINRCLQILGSFFFFFFFSS